MKLNALGALGKATSKLGMKLQKNSPEILIGVGIGVVIFGGVMACRATLKASKTIEHAKEELDAMDITEDDEYTEKDRKHDITLVYAHAGLELAKEFAPAVLLTGLGVGLICKSHNILKGRNLALTAAYATVQQGFAEYRKRVQEEFGDDIDQKLRYGIKTQEVNVVTESEENEGEFVTEKREVPIVDPNLKHSRYAIWYDAQHCTEYKSNPKYQEFHLQSLQRYANDLLYANGHVFLNEILDSFGHKRTKEGSVVGWVLNGKGDNEIDFKVIEVYDQYDEESYERRYIIDFNVDGVIWDMI